MAKTKEVRQAVKEQIMAVGYRNLLNKHVNEIVEHIGCTYCDVQNAISYFKYSSQQATFRSLYF